MTTSQPKSEVFEIRYVWGPTITEAMELAQWLEKSDWIIHGNPAPMIYKGNYGIGVTLTRKSND